MSRRSIPIVALSVLALMLVGCEGDTGPMGPTGPQGPTGPAGPDMVLAYGRVEGTQAVPDVSGLGPMGLLCDCARMSTGHYTVTIFGRFPVTEGILLVSSTSGTQGDYLDDNLTSGEISSWTATRIVFNVQTMDNDYDGYMPEDSDFAFVVMRLE